MSLPGFSYIIVFLCIVGFMPSGCHYSEKNSPPPIFKNEKAMQLFLKGRWILKGYEDSTDAGLSPKLLEYMLGQKISIQYGKIAAGWLSFDDDTSEQYTVRCDNPCNKIYLKIKTAGRSPGADTAEFIIADGDTILRIYADSAIRDYVKYDVGMCIGINEYSHLVNSKFIAGKYYALADTAHRHHIIFTRCGGIEGASFIAPEFKDMTNYDVVLAGFFTDPDQVSLYNIHAPNWRSIDQNIHWDVVNDSLKLWHDRFGKTEPIVLVKVQ
jgi:hypothetical protein